MPHVVYRTRFNLKMRGVSGGWLGRSQDRNRGRANEGQDLDLTMRNRDSSERPRDGDGFHRHGGLLNHRETKRLPELVRDLKSLILELLAEMMASSLSLCDGHCDHRSMGNGLRSESSCLCYLNL